MNYAAASGKGYLIHQYKPIIIMVIMAIIFAKKRDEFTLLFRIARPI